MYNATFLYSFLAILAGVAVPILASINSAYGQTIGNVHWASLTLCVVAFITILIVTIASGVSMPSLATFQQASWWHLLGGGFFAVYVVLITFVAPKIGLGNAIIFVVVAQMFTAITIDHFGLLGAAVQQLDWKRTLGIAFLIAGVALARSVPSSAGN
ncbi:MAG: DMT family transporter [Hyphomicrobiales bacterium]